MVFWEEARGWSARQAPTTITHNSHMFPKELTVVAQASALISQEFCPSYTLTMSTRKGPLYCEGQRGLERAISPATGPRLSVEVSVSSRASTGQLRCSSATAFPSSTLPSLKHFRGIFWVSFPPQLEIFMFSRYVVKDFQLKQKCKTVFENLCQCDGKLGC